MAESDHEMYRRVMGIGTGPVRAIDGGFTFDEVEIVPVEPEDDHEFYFDDDETDECHHEEYQIDILTGRAECEHCPHAWWASSDEMRRESERQAEYAIWQEAEYRREWWRDLFAPLRSFWWHVTSLLRPKAKVVNDDDIPF